MKCLSHSVCATQKPLTHKVYYFGNHRYIYILLSTFSSHFFTIYDSLATWIRSYPNIVLMHKREIIQTDMEPKYREFFDSLSQEFYDRVLLQSKDQYASNGFTRVIAKWYKEGFEKAFGFHSSHISHSIYILRYLWSPAWHCIAGPEFAATVTHEAKTLMYFSIQFSASVKKSNQSSTDEGPERQKRQKESPPLAYWRILLFKAG